MNAQTAFRLSTLAFAAALTACGGGEDTTQPDTDVTVSEGPSHSSRLAVTAPKPPVAAPKPGAVSVKLARINIKRTDILAQTKSRGSSRAMAAVETVFMATAGKFISDATAATAPNIKPGANIGFTNKVVGGKLTSLGVQLTDSRGNPLFCGTSTAEVVIDRLWVTNKSKGHMMAKMKVPAALTADCTVSSYREGTFAVSAAGVVTDISVAGDAVTSVIEAGDEGFNISANNVVIYASGIVRELSVSDTGAARLTDLTTLTMPVKTGLGQIAYDGQQLMAFPQDNKFAGVIVMQKGQQGFKMLPIGKTNYAHIGFGPANQFVFRSWEQVDGIPRAINLTTRKLSKIQGDWEKVAVDAEDPMSQPGMGNFYPPTAVSGKAATPVNYPHGYNGRTGDWMLTRDCMLWNMKSGDFVVPQLLGADGDTTLAAGYSRLAKNKATCQGGAGGQRFTQYTISTGKFVSFDLYEMGFFPKGIEQDDIYAYGDTLVVKIVDSADSSVRFIELNFVTGKWSDRGVIATATRQVTELVPIGN